MRSIRRFVKHWSGHEDMETSRIDTQILADAHQVRRSDASLEPVTLSPNLSDSGESSSTLMSQRPNGPSSPSKVFRRLPSSPSLTNLEGRPSRQKRTNTTAASLQQAAAHSQSLRVRPRSKSHPSLRALINDYERFEGMDRYASEDASEDDLDQNRAASNGTDSLPQPDPQGSLAPT